MRNIWKKLTASLLALVLTVQLLPVSALADEFEIDDEPNVMRLLVNWSLLRICRNI